MGSLAQHASDCQKFLGEPFREVHEWLDARFRDLGPYHRSARHHFEGMHEAAEIFGDAAKTAAAVHILRDCRHIPSERDYRLGFVDALGLKRTWSTAAYIRYSDAEFEALVREHLRPTALALWSFLRWEDVVTFLSSATHLSEEEVSELKPLWQKARATLNPHEQSIPLPPFQPLSATSADEQTRSYLNDVFEQATSNIPEPKKSTAAVGYIPVSALSQPFVYIDYELLEDLKPELNGSTSLEVAQFAIPTRVGAPMTAVGDASQRTVTFISRQKTISVSNVKLRSTDEGTEVSYIVSASASAILVSKFGEMYLLSNGIHRAYILAQLGIDPIPCIVVDEGDDIPFSSSTYPTFTPPMLMQQRRPMLSDFFRPELCLQVPVRRTNRLIRISADSTNIPVE